MGRLSYWYPLAKSLANYLNNQLSEKKDGMGTPIPLFDGVDVYVGTKGKGRDYPCIEVTWESESNVSNSLPTVGEVSLWVDVCVEADDDEPEQAYVMQDELQSKIFDCLPKWPPVAREDTGIAPNVTIEEIVSDGDIYRPVSISRIVLSIEWRKAYNGK